MSDVCIGSHVSDAAAAVDELFCLRQSLAPGGHLSIAVSQQIRQNIPRPPPLHRSLHRPQGAPQLMQPAVCTCAARVEDDLVCLTETFTVLSHEAKGHVQCKCLQLYLIPISSTRINNRNH